MSKIPGGFLDADDFERQDDDAKSESWKAVNQHGNALFKKSIDILNLATSLCDMLPDEEGNPASTKSLIMQNAHIVPPKIRGAQAMEFYSLKMENAVIIKVNAMELKTMLHACNIYHDIEEKYTDVLRNEIDTFQKIFVDWVCSFDKDNDLPDDWHLFNDPSSFPDDDDEPFDAQDFMNNLDLDDE